MRLDTACIIPLLFRKSVQLNTSMTYTHISERAQLEVLPYTASFSAQFICTSLSCRTTMPHWGRKKSKRFSSGILLHVLLAGEKDCLASLMILEIQLVTSLSFSVMVTI